MDFFHAVILGVIEGITEFLPISSTGHLILASNLLKIEQTEFVKTFEIAIQSGAILSVVFLYGRTLLKDIQTAKRVIVAFIPTALIGFTLYKYIKHYLIGNSEVVLISLFLGGIVLILVELLFKNKSEPNPKIRNLKLEIRNSAAISYEKSIVIGLFQAVAMIPGVSRAAATIIGGMLVGLPRKTAVEFSFLLAIPTMLAATALDLTSFLPAVASLKAGELTSLALGFITSFVVALIAVKWLLKYVESNNFIPFGIYRIAVSIIYFILILK